VIYADVARVVAIARDAMTGVAAAVAAVVAVMCDTARNLCPSV